MLAVEQRVHGSGPRRGGLVVVVPVEQIGPDVGPAGVSAGVSSARVRECARPECTRLFVDRSRGGTRHWCGMEECGNRVKAANYRSRKKG
ncbi:CGNR zinc finger domain-containing protein [Microbispora sp. KK1-11]|nr:CGNR zinc finger domain-containing protein [Microbispora sp. KK1-11]